MSLKPHLSLSAFMLTCAVFLSLAAANPARACGPDTDCVIGERTYRIRMPEGHDGKTPVGAIFHMHGYRGSAAAVMNNRALERAVSNLGLALVAPKSFGEDWAIRGSPSGKPPAEMDYFDALMVDVTTRFPIDINRTMATGFSAGGMMVWNLICRRSRMFTAFAPIAGTFWEPVPEICPSPTANVIHTHGMSDRVVPMSGRPIGNTRQGDVKAVIDGYVKRRGFSQNGSYNVVALEMRCEQWNSESGQTLELCTHPRGHDMRRDYLQHAWRRFERLGVIPR